MEKELAKENDKGLNAKEDKWIKGLMDFSWTGEWSKFLAECDIS